jgi:hypothetical protein
MNTPALHAQIRSLVARWLASPDHADLTEAVRVSGALPVYSDMGGTLFIRPDGEVLFLEIDSEDDEPRPLADEAWRMTAVVVGAERYPELRPLVPSRPADTPDCDACAGRGRIRVAESDQRFLCGRCYGLGWLNLRSSELPPVT